ncbi:MAG: DUF480 domain-containing protein [Rubripirellula sp.]
MTDDSSEEKQTPVPLSAAARRVLAVLVEKAKTTPDSYPLSLAGVISGSNQKSNRSPKMDLDEDDAVVALDELRELGAAREIQGSGRVLKYRHAAYEWLDVDSPQSAVMTELLLRGPQTLGEIRTRASRMYKLDDLNAAKTVVLSLVEKGLVEAVTPAGRGQMFTHTLYQPDERQYLGLRLEKQAADKPKPDPNVNRNAVDQLLARLETVTERIDSLEQRIGELEGPNSES